MLRSVQLALVAAAAVAVTSGLAEAQTGPGPRNFDGPRSGYGQQYSYGYGNGYGRPHRFNQYNQNNQNNQNGPNQYRNGPPRNGPPGNGRQGPPAQATATRGWLGVQLQPLDQNLADAFKLPNTSGALISDTQSGSPAATAGIKPGDVVLAVDGKAVNSPRDLATLIAGDQPNMNVTVSVWRGGTRQDVAVKLGSQPGGPQGGPNQGNRGNANPPPPPPSGGLGLTIGPARGQGGGVVISDVARNSPADKAGLVAGDQILAVGGTTVATTDDVSKAVAAAKQGGSKDVLMQVRSGQTTKFVAIPLG